MTGEVAENKRFPKGALTVFIIVFIGIAVYDMLTRDAGLAAREGTGILVAGGIAAAVLGILGALVGLSIQYAFIKFPTQWISKEEFVYKYDIWEAIFYSSTVGIVMNFMLRQFDFQDNLLMSVVVSVITTGLFLYIYFSGKEKEAHIKRAIIIVQIIWLVLSIILGVTLNTLYPDFIG